MDSAEARLCIKLPQLVVFTSNWDHDFLGEVIGPSGFVGPEERLAIFENIMRREMLDELEQEAAYREYVANPDNVHDRTYEDYADRQPLYETWNEARRVAENLEPEAPVHEEDDSNVNVAVPVRSQPQGWIPVVTICSFPLWFFFYGLFPFMILGIVAHFLCAVFAGGYRMKDRLRNSAVIRTTEVLNRGYTEIKACAHRSYANIKCSFVERIKRWVFGCCTRVTRAFIYLGESPIRTLTLVNLAKCRERKEIKDKAWTLSCSKLYPLIVLLLNNTSHQVFQYLLLVISLLGCVVDVECVEDKLTEFIDAVRDPQRINAVCLTLNRQAVDPSDLEVLIEGDAEALVNAIVHLLFAFREFSPKVIITRFNLYLGSAEKSASKIEATGVVAEAAALINTTANNGTSGLGYQAHSMSVETPTTVVPGPQAVQSPLEDHKGETNTPDWFRGIKKYKEVQDFYHKFKGELSERDESDVYTSVMEDMDDELMRIEDRHRGSLFGIADFSAKDRRRYAEITRCMDDISSKYNRDHNSGEYRIPDRYLNLMFAPPKNPKKYKYRVEEWSKAKEGFQGKWLLRQVKSIDEAIKNHDAASEPAVEPEKSDHAIVEEGFKDTIDLKLLQGYRDFTISFYGREKYTTRGVRVKVKVNDVHVTGIMTNYHIIPGEYVLSGNYDVTNFEITCEGAVHRGDMKNTQLIRFHCDRKCRDNTNNRIAGGDCLLVVDKRFNQGKAASIGNISEGGRVVFKCPEMYTQGTITVPQDVGVCHTLAYVDCSTDINHGASGTPVFQFKNGVPYLVAINKGRDDRKKTHSLVQQIAPLNAKYLQGSTGIVVRPRLARPQCQPGVKV
jgi:hypothetical protein